MGAPRILVLDRGEQLAMQLQGVADELRPRPEVVVCTRVGQVGEVIEAEGPFDVLVAGPSLGTRSGLLRLRVIREELPLTSIVLAFSRRPDASLPEIIRAGAVDMLHLPADDKEIIEALERAIAIAERARETAGVPAAAEAPAATDRTPRHGRVITIASATGGCGKTFLATNLAWFVHRFTGKRAVIVDLDLQFGEVSTALRLRPRYTIYDALAHGDISDEDLGDLLEEYTTVHDTGVHVLAAPKDPSEADRISPPDVTRVVRLLRDRFDFVIVDTPPQLDEVVLAAFDLSDLMYVMATLDLPSVRNMSVFLGTLERLKIPAENVRLILNKAESDVGIDVDQVRRLFPQGFTAVLPYAKEVSRSINLGMPVLASSPTAPISRALAKGLRELLSPEEAARLDEAMPERRRGLFRRRARAG